MTITWNIDDLNISHQDSKEVSRMIRRLKNLYGQHGNPTVSQGKKHEYLGIMLDYSKKGKVIVDMLKYTKETHKMFPEEMAGQVNTPTRENLFDVREDVDKLIEKTDKLSTQ